MDTKVYCPKCGSDSIYWEQRTTEYHRAVFNSNFGMELVELVDSEASGGDFYCPDCHSEYDWDTVSEFMENRNG